MEAAADSSNMHLITVGGCTIGSLPNLNALFGCCQQKSLKKREFMMIKVKTSMSHVFVRVLVCLEAQPKGPLFTF